MLNVKKNWTLLGYWTLLGLLLCSTQAAASITSFGTIDVNGTEYSSGAPGGNFNQFEVDAGNGLTIDVSGWSDTFNQSGADDIIERAADFDRNGNGWSIENRDENPDRYCGYSHSADNFSCTDGDWTDYDFFLLDFGSTEVHLTEVYSSWLANSGNGQEVSVAALNSNHSTDLTGSTFSSLLSNDQGSNSFRFSSSTGTAGQNIASYYADVSGITNAGETVFSSKWIVSAYNVMFGTVSGGSANNDGFKLAGVNFTTKTPKDDTPSIPEPATILLMGLGLLGFSNRKLLKK
jgi:hypothetical protein